MKIIAYHKIKQFIDSASLYSCDTLSIIRSLDLINFYRFLNSHLNLSCRSTFFEGGSHSHVLLTTYYELFILYLHSSPCFFLPPTRWSLLFHKNYLYFYFLSYLKVSLQVLFAKFISDAYHFLLVSDQVSSLVSFDFIPELILSCCGNFLPRLVKIHLKFCTSIVSIFVRVSIIISDSMFHLLYVHQLDNLPT